MGRKRSILISITIFGAKGSGSISLRPKFFILVRHRPLKKRQKVDSARRSISAIAVLAVVVLAYASCAPIISRHEKGAVTVRIGSGSGSRAVTDVVASFSSVSVAVSGDGMGTVSETVTGYSLGSPISLEVPAGDDRLVTVTAVPASSAPTLATEFGGSATVDVDKGKTASANVALAVTGTKIVLPDYDGTGYVYVHNNLSAPSSASINPMEDDMSLAMASDTAFDEAGRAYLSLGYNVVRIGSDNVLTSIANLDYGDGAQNLAIDSRSSAMYATWWSDYNFLVRFDLSEENPAETSVGLPTLLDNDGSTIDSVVEVDADGYLFVTGTNTTNGDRIIAKLVVSGDGETFTSSVVDTARFEEVGLSYEYWNGENYETRYLTPMDMIVRDGNLYVLAVGMSAPTISGDADSATSRGKIVAVSTSGLNALWTTGWSGDTNNFPTSPSSQFYGPVRFVGIAPRKLYVMDDGFTWNGSNAGGTNPYDNVNRVVEVDTSLNTITDTGLSGIAEFYTDYSSITLSVC
jgi:hypothetical protein